MDSVRGCHLITEKPRIFHRWFEHKVSHHLGERVGMIRGREEGGAGTKGVRKTGKGEWDKEPWQG